MKTPPILVALCACFATAPLLASDDCDVPVEQWQSRDAVMRMAAQQGWQVQRLKIDDGCYELRGRDAQGRDFKAKLDPQTLKPVKMKVESRDHERDRDRERKRERAHAPAASAAGATGASAPGPVLVPGTTPRASIE